MLMNPRIPPDKIGPFYPTTYYTNKPVHVSPKQWKRSIKAVVLQRYYGYPPANQFRHIHRLLGYLAGIVVSRAAGFQHNIHCVPGGRVLDVGCGNGACLSRYKALGWQTFGTEVGPESASLARAAGHDIFLGELHDAHYPDGFFDAVTLWDALEHIPNPRETMAEVNRICRPGGRVYVYVPNYGSWYARRFHDKWFMFTAPLHYYHYTSQTLTLLLTKSGFHNVQILYPLGGAGIAPTISAATLRFSILHSVAVNFFFGGLLRAADPFMPRGHLLAIGLNSDSQETK